MPKEFFTADAIWPGETCFIVAGGTSLLGFDFQRLRGRKIIAINSSMFSVPFADVAFYGDSRWGFENSDRVTERGGLIITTAEAHKAQGVNLMRKQKPPPALAMDRQAVVMDRTSLHASINLAVHFGVSKIVLMGADMRPGEKGRTHHHDPHPWPSINGCWDHQMAQLILLPKALRALGIEVVNTSLESRIDWWPKRPINEELDEH